MVLPRKKCRVLITWLLLLAFAQLLMYALLFSEFESVPRTKIQERLLQNHHSSKDFFPVEAKARNREETILKSDSKFESRHQISSDLTSKTGTRQQILSRKLEKIKVDKELFPILNVDSVPNIETSKVKRQDDDKSLQEAKEVFQKSKSRLTEPDDIFISVKTTKQYHDTRVQEIIDTWWSIARQQTYLFTDTEDPILNNTLGGHLINTQCNSGHQRAALCCKMASELRFFWEQMRKRWFCHFDDDNYVHFPALIKLLRQYDHSKPIYLGRTSTQRQMTAWDKDDRNKRVHFWFATGGAGLCLSRGLVSLMVPYFSGEAFPDTCARVGLPDDCTIGFISEYLLKVKLKEIDLFHSHLEWLGDIPQHLLHEQVSFSHGHLGRVKNHVQIDGPFDINDDPSRFKSIHCYLFPQTSWCLNNQRKKMRMNERE